MDSVPTSKKITKEESEAISSFLTKHNFSANTFTKTVTYKIDHSTDTATFKKTPNFAWPFLKDPNEEKLTEVNSELEELKKTHKLFERFEVRTGLDAGDAFAFIPDVTKVFGDDEKFAIKHIDGQVLLVDFWATW